MEAELTIGALSARTGVAPSAAPSPCTPGRARPGGLTRTTCRSGGEEFEVRTRVDTEWRPRYRFDLEPLWLRDSGALDHPLAEAS